MERKKENHKTTKGKNFQQRAVKTHLVLCYGRRLLQYLFDRLDNGFRAHGAH